MSGDSEGLQYFNCSNCGLLLNFTKPARFLQCPKCDVLMNPDEPDVNYTNCVGCPALLSFSLKACIIQCPSCTSVMDMNKSEAGFSGPEFSAKTVPPSSNTASPSRSGSLAGRKSLKNKKDPKAPKRPMNPYMIFSKERRPRLKEERPDLPFGKLGQALGEIWRAMPQEEKKPYETRAIDDRERYRKELIRYHAVTGATNEGGRDDEGISDRNRNDAMSGSKSSLGATTTYYQNLLLQNMIRRKPSISPEESSMQSEIKPESPVGGNAGEVMKGSSESAQGESPKRLYEKLERAQQELRARHQMEWSHMMEQQAQQKAAQKHQEEVLVELLRIRRQQLESEIQTYDSLKDSKNE